MYVCRMCEGPGGVPLSAATNLFDPGFEFDAFFYLSEKDPAAWLPNETEPFWSLEGLRYGDWTGGQAGDGTFTLAQTIQLSQVSCPYPISHIPPITHLS